MGLFGFDSAGDFKVNNRYLSLAGTRQTVQSGLVDSTGAANFISIGTGLSVNIAATAVPIFLNASGGNVISGRIGRVAADTSIAGLTASATSFLFADVAIDGGVTLGAGVLAPIYQFGGTPTVTNGQFTFNISEMKGYLGNSTTAPQAYRVYLGEAITNATNVTSVVNYALNGMYDSGYSAMATGTQVLKNHNIGVNYLDVIFHVLVVSVGSSGFAVGDVIQSDWKISSSAVDNEGYTAANDSKVLKVNSGANANFIILTATGVGYDMPKTNLNMKFIVKRGW